MEKIFVYRSFFTHDQKQIYLNQCVREKERIKTIQNTFFIVIPQAITEIKYRILIKYIFRFLYLSHVKYIFISTGVRMFMCNEEYRSVSFSHLQSSNI